MAGSVTLDLGHRVLRRSGRPFVMGILNITPDSFSDGGRHMALEAAVAQASRLVAEGAEILDIGGESTRPGAAPVSAQEEMRRVLPVLDALADVGLEVPVSIDTRHAATAASALRREVDLVNDVSSLADPEMAHVVADHDVGLVLMHMQGEPGTMQAAPAYADVVVDVREALRGAVASAVSRGILLERIIVDPGLGFGKRTGDGVEDNCALLSGLPEIVRLGRPVLVGASRKRFIGNLSGVDVAEARLAGSLTAAVAAAWGGASVVRVHDVAPTVQALDVAAAIDPRLWGA